MSASKRGTGWRHTVRYIRCFITSAGRAVIAEVGTAVAEYKTVRTQKHRTISLKGLNDHTLRDIGLIRDRFTGTVLNDAIGIVLDRECQQADEATAVASDNPALLHRHMIERRQAERRTAERRHIARQKSSEPEGVQPASAYPVQDRRAFDRRSSDHRIIDCRGLFSGRPRFLLA